MLKPASIEKFRKDWEFVKEGLAVVKRERGGSWRPEDIYAAVINRQAFYWWMPEGFVILKPIQDEYSHQPILLVWLAYGKGGDDLIAKYGDQVKEIAREQGFEKLQYYRAPKSAPDGTRKPIMRDGWEKVWTIYEYDLM